MAKPVSSDTLLAENRRLKDQLAGASKTIGALQQLLEKAINEAAGESSKNAEILEELGLAKLIVNQSPAVLFRRKAGDTPTLEYVSENLTRFGYEPEDFMAERVSFKDIVHKDDQERVTEEINRYAEDDLEEYTQVYRILTKDGDIRWVEDQTSVVRDEQGNKIHNQGILIDITERKNAEEKLRKSEEKFRRIVETAAEGFLLMDEDFRIIDVNQAYCKMLGYQRQDLLGKMVHDFAADDFKSFLRANQELFLSAEQREFEGEVMASDGRIIPILVHGNTLRDDHGAAIGNMAFITDMTEHKKALVLAGEVQKSLLPSKMPQVNGLDIAGRNVSCDEIGGIIMILSGDQVRRKEPSVLWWAISPGTGWTRPC